MMPVTQARILRCHNCNLLTIHRPETRDSGDPAWQCDHCLILSETVQGALRTFEKGDGDEQR